jgi:hypothetical protein
MVGLWDAIMTLLLCPVLAHGTSNPMSHRKLRGCPAPQEEFTCDVHDKHPNS